MDICRRARLILQTLDIKNNCKGVFYKNKVIEDPDSQILKKCKYTWKHSSILENYDYDYLSLYLKGQDLKQYADDIDAFTEIRDTILSQQKAAKIAKVELQNQCFFNILPEFQIKKWFSLRHSALERVLDQVPRPPEYDILYKAHVLCSFISKRNLIYQDKVGNIDYNIFGSVTGRLTTKRGSIPILTMKKEERPYLKPSNDAYLELDFNAAEVRTLIALSGQEQPGGDIHNWVSKLIYEGKLPREKVKTKLFAWLYNFSASENELSKIFSRQIFRDFYSKKTGILKTPFKREIKVEERKAQNYLLQSTTSDIVIENAYKIMKILSDKKSDIAFLLHDSIIIDFHKDDIHLIKDLKSIFEKTAWGNFKSTCKVGKNFGSLREMKI